MSDLVKQLHKVIDTPRGRIPVSVIYLCRNAANELERLTAELAAAKGLLARCGNHIRDWHAKYGEHQPQWLPPANGALFIQAIDAALTDTPAGPQQSERKPSGSD